jgi:APA family basic amino acid/polyamine antiporter
MSHREPQRLLTPLAAVAIIVGVVIGAGIFKTPAMVAGVAGDIGWIMTAWIAGAIISLAGALCYAELCTAYPHAGGDYHFLTLAYGKKVSFLYAWAKAMVINTGSIALLAFVFGDYMSKVVSLGSHSAVLWAIIIIAGLTLVNIVGLHTSARVQSLLTALEVLGLLIIVAAGFLLAPASASSAAAPFSASPPIGLLGLALVFVLLTFGGWNESAYISAEVRGGPRTMVPVIIISLLVITVIYLLVNAALIHGLGVEGLAKSKAPGAELLQVTLGPWGERAISVFVAIATLTSINATLIVGARANYALGRDWPALQFLGYWQPEKGSPTAAYLTQGVIALALVGFGALQSDGFEAMVEFTAPVFWAFLFMVGLSLFILRVRDRNQHRPFRVPLYPFTPLLFCISCAYLTYSSLSYAQSKGATHIAMAVMAVGCAALAALLLAGKRRATA